MAPCSVRSTPLGAVVSRTRIRAGSQTVPPRGHLYVFAHRGIKPPSPVELKRRRRAQQLRSLNGVAKEQEQSLPDRILSSAQLIKSAGSNQQASPVQRNVCELIFSGFTPYERPIHQAILAHVLNRSMSPIEHWFDNGRENRTRVGRKRVTTAVASDTMFDAVYPDKRRLVEETSLERLVQLIEAERDRQTILLGERGFVQRHEALKEQAGLSPELIAWLRSAEAQSESHA